MEQATEMPSVREVVAETKPAEEAGIVDVPKEIEPLILGKCVKLVEPVQVPSMKHNQVRVIYPWKEGCWIFDDASVGLEREAFVSNFGVIIDDMVKDIKDSQDGFSLWFSGAPFPGAEDVFTLANADGKENKWGNDYKYDKDGRVGWLCPALYKYFDVAPDKLYFKCEELKNKRPIIGRKMEGLFEKYYEDFHMHHKMMREMGKLLGYTITEIMPQEVTDILARFRVVHAGFKAERWVTRQDQYYWRIYVSLPPEEIVGMLKGAYEAAAEKGLKMFVENVNIDGKTSGVICVETDLYEPGEAFRVSKYFYWQGWTPEDYMTMRQEDRL